MSVNFNFGKPSIDGENAIVEADDSAYLENLPEGLSVTTLKSVESFNHDYIDSFAEATASEATKVLKKNKKVNEVLVKAPFGSSKRDGVTAKVRRSVERRNPKTGDKYTTPSMRVDLKWKGAIGTKSKQANLLKEMREQIAG